MGPEPEPVTVPHPTPLQEAMEANLHAHFAYLQRRLPGMAVLDSPDLLLVDSGLPSDTFNQVARARLDPASAGRRIAEAVAHFREAGRPFSWWVGPGSRPLDLQARLEGHGLRLAESELAMALDLTAPPDAPDAPAPEGPPGDPPGLEVRRAAGAAGGADFAAVMASNWEPHDPAVLAFYGAAAPVLLEPGCPMRLFVGYLDGVPVATCELFAAAGVGGLYAVVTRRAYRRRGIGGAVVGVALDAARGLGLTAATLQASAAGQGVYARLGFRACGRVAEYK